MLRSTPARLVAAGAVATAVATGGWAATALSSPSLRIDHAVLVDADRDRPTAADRIADGAVLDLAALGAGRVSIEAVPAGPVGSVRFEVDGRVQRVENHRPYALAGDAASGRDYLPWTGALGRHEVVITPFSGSQATGTAGPALRLRITVVAGGGAPAPSLSPISPPPAAPSPSATATPTRPPAPSPAPTGGGLPPTTGRYFYVSGTGDDSRDGRTAGTALRTPQRAADQTQPGDTVLLMDGTYTQADPNQNVLTITRDGRPGHPVTYAALPGARPTIRVRNWSGVLVGASYVTLQGLTVEGNAAQITLAEALAAKDSTNSPVTSGGGISVTNPYDDPGKHPHDVTIRGTTVSGCAGGGISAVRADRLTIEDNTVFGNAKYSPWANSGISVYQAWNTDPSTGYKIVIRRNVVHDNENLVPFLYSASDPAKRTITDGNGIIVDDLRATQDFVAGKGAPYTGRVLVENNVVYRNGGRGIHAYSSDHVDVVNNTLFENSRSPAIEDGELTAFDAADIRFLGNAVVPSAGRPATNFGSPGGVTAGANVTGAAVRYIDPARGDFRLATGSAAIDGGANPLAPATDITGRPRPAGRAPDAGAYESA